MGNNRIFSFLNNTQNKRCHERYETNHYEHDDCGYANGYVAIPPSHPMHGKKHGDVSIDVHGGLTFSKPMDYVKYVFKDTECLGFDSLDEIPNDYWVFGFDTMHLYDNYRDEDRDYCVWETEKMVDQFKDLA